MLLFCDYLCNDNNHKNSNPAKDGTELSTECDDNNVTISINN